MIDHKRIAGILNSEPVDLRTENAELRAEVKRLTAELAKCQRDYEHYVNGVRTVEEELLARVTVDRDACIAFISTEMHWCEFRGEMLCDSVSVQNANKLAAFLDRRKAVEANPEPRPVVVREDSDGH